VDFYSSKLRPKANDAEKIKFGRVITVCIAVLCASIAIALEGISLLKIDMFSGIFFAAPCCTLIAGMYLRSANETTTLLATFTGLTAGLATWVYFGLSSESWFYGCLLSFLTPILVIFISSPFTKERFNFAKLRFYKADQKDQGTDLPWPSKDDMF
jgi:Na+/proline symporter